MNVETPKAKAIFLDAVDRYEAPQWPQYLGEACGGDVALRRRVEVLLRAHARSAGLLDALGDDSGQAAESSPAVGGVGTTIGPYKLLEQIGEGGMGVVHVAEQSQPVRRRVALKVIKLGMDTRQVVARFEAERQALAMMDHPNIAKVLDAGATETGRPYFVMELVRGIPITDYCDRERLSVPQRLELFVLVCRAVQHAHQKGIIHRDLKPSNILVTVIDGAAVPKVIDFGVAKATGASLTERTIYTAFHQFIGTPLYMSPEQADLSGMDTDTRSDIYSLGVLLYELLTGTTPFDQETFRQAAFDEVRRIIREDEPPKPSTRLSSLSATRSAVSTDHKSDARHRDRTVHGELDWIVMKALEKDRRRRYETANDFASDVMRHLTDQPVEACPPSAKYRLSKYARRNRGFLATAGLIAVVLIATTSVSVWQAALARKAQRQAATEADIARAVNDFLQDDLLGQASQVGEEMGENPFLTVKVALDRAAARIGRRFRHQPLVEASIRMTIGRAYNSLNEHGLAVPHLERAITLRMANLGPDHPDTIASMYNLGNAYGWLGRHPERIALQHRILENRRAVLGPNHPETMASVAGLATAYQEGGQLDVSRGLLEDLLSTQVARYGPANPATLGTMHQLALSYLAEGRLAKSIAMHEKLLKLSESSGDSARESTVGPMMILARACLLAGKFDRADQLLREVFELKRNQEDSLGRQLGIANVLGWQAQNRLLQQQYDAAEPLAREALSTWEKLQPNWSRRFHWMSVLGDVLLGQQRYAEAEPLLLQGYKGMKQREAILPMLDRRLLTGAGERLLRFYEVTQQPEKARMWRERMETE